MLTFKTFMKTHDIRDLQYRSANPAMGPSQYRAAAAEDEEQQQPQPDEQPEEVGSAMDQQPQEQPQDDSMNDNPDGENGDPDKQGLIRTIPGAHLVFKRKVEEGTFDELWIYSINEKGLRTEYQVRAEILAGTDIPINQTKSEDGSQYCELWTAGTAQLLFISGLPN